MADRAGSVEYEVRDGGLWRIERPDPSAALGTQALQQLAAIELDEGSGRAVHEGDFFEYEYGINESIRHIPSPDYDGTQPLTHVYVVAHFKDGGHYIDVMTRKEVEKVRDRSRASKFGPWVTDFESMARKTVIRRAFPYMPVSVEVQADVISDERTPIVNDADSGPLFEFMDDSAMETPANVDPETGEIQEEENND